MINIIFDRPHEENSPIGDFIVENSIHAANAVIFHISTEYFVGSMANEN